MTKLGTVCSNLVSKDDISISDDVHYDIKEVGVSIQMFDGGLKFYSNEKLKLSKLYPILESMNFEVLDQISLEVDGIYIMKFNLDNLNPKKLLENFENIRHIFLVVLNFELPHTCKLLSLGYLVNASVREIWLLKALGEYQNQVTPDNQYEQIVYLLTHNTKLTLNILNYFKLKFDPSLKLDNRTESASEAYENILESLRDIDDINQDKIAKMMVLILENIVRTNYYLDKNTISLKIETVNFKHLLRGTQPNVEAFVYSRFISGVHLRTGYICRGGLRWSQRYADYRDEVKSLMTAQESKNSVIVPSGSKGGFVIKKDNISKEEFEMHYTSYIDAILDLVDTKDGNNIIKNSKIISYDNDDTYFVVAADKGTSAMSDVANNIAIDKGFWLKDSFASGGSSGYHHKKLGITAKGAIRSSQRFFIEKGVDFYKDEISIVGIGSMNGDVFGNGLIESKYFKLVAAISHKEIFIDPNPNLEEAYNERLRLFNAKNGAWGEYKKLSKGGAVYKRDQKDIKVSKEIKELLSLDVDVIDADKLAQTILTLKVDMLYSGGVGTYVKSSDESNLEVGDKENEFVRVNAKDIKAFTICEGANLSVTQKARVEYALHGGKINLDSIDNSAGVDTSDHEVNYKILFNILKEQSFIDNRDELLQEQTDFVVEDVLNTTYRQALSISLDEIRSSQNINSFNKTLDVLNSQLEFFNQKTFQVEELKTYNGKVIRPMLAILTLYTKVFMQKLLLESNMLEDKEFNYYLDKYFSKQFIASFSHTTTMHPLRKEIIAMKIANKIINATGASFISDFNELGTDKFMLKIKSYLILNRFFTATNMRRYLFKKDYNLSCNEQYKLFITLEDSLLRGVESLMELNSEDISFEHILSYKNSLDRILELKISSGSQDIEDIDKYFGMLKYLQLATESLKLELSSSSSFNDVAQTYFNVANRLNLIDFMDILDNNQCNDSKEMLMQKQLHTIIKSIISRVTRSILKFKRHDETLDDSISNYFKEINFDFEDFKQLQLNNDSFENISLSVNYLVIKIL